MRLAKDKERDKAEVTSEQDVAVEPEVESEVVAVSLLESCVLIFVFSSYFFTERRQPRTAEQSQAHLAHRQDGSVDVSGACSSAVAGGS